MKLLSPIVWITALAAALRLRGLGAESLWYDESWTAMLVSGRFGDVFSTLVARDAHPPLYYACLWPWVRIFGDGEAGLRSFSAALGIASVPILFRTASRMISPRAGLTAALLLALSPFHVYFSQEARTYALVIFLALLSMDLATSNPMTRGKWLALSVATALLVYSHYLAILFIAAECLWVLVAFRNDRAFLLRWFGSMALAALLFLPWAGVAYDHLRWIQSDFWIRPVTGQTVAMSMDELLVRAYGYAPREIGAMLPFVWVAAGAAATAVAWRERALSLAWILFVVPIALEILWSLRRPIFYTRTFGYVLPAAILLAALAVDRIQNRKAAGALLAALAASCVPGLLFIHLQTEKEDWRGLAARVRDAAKPGDAILFYPLTPLNDFRCSFDYYARGWTPPPRVCELPSGRVDLEAVRARISGADRIFLILRYGNGRLDPALARELEKGCRAAESEFHGPLLIEYSQGGR